MKDLVLHKNPDCIARLDPLPDRPPRDVVHHVHEPGIGNGIDSRAGRTDRHPFRVHLRLQEDRIDDVHGIRNLGAWPAVG